MPDDILLNYKLAVLYLLDNIEWPVSTNGICEVLLEELYSNFFHLQQAIGELAAADMIRKETVGNTTYYSITPAGKEGFAYLEKELSMDLRRAILDRMHALHMDTRRSLVSYADYSSSITGGVHVHCRLMDGKDAVIDLKLMVPGVEAAKAICAKWPLKSQDLYVTLMEELM